MPQTAKSVFAYKKEGPAFIGDISAGPGLEVNSNAHLMG